MLCYRCLLALASFPFMLRGTTDATGGQLSFSGSRADVEPGMHTYDTRGLRPVFQSVDEGCTDCSTSCIANGSSAIFALDLPCTSLAVRASPTCLSNDANGHSPRECDSRIALRIARSGSSCSSPFTHESAAPCRATVNVPRKKCCVIERSVSHPTEPDSCAWFSIASTRKHASS